MKFFFSFPENDDNNDVFYSLSKAKKFSLKRVTMCITLNMNAFVLIKQAESSKKICGSYVNFWTKYKSSQFFVAQFI